MNWKFWEKPKHDIEFIDTSRQVYQMHPVELAKPIRPHFYKNMMQLFLKSIHGTVLIVDVPSECTTKQQYLKLFIDQVMATHKHLEINREDI